MNFDNSLELNELAFALHCRAQLKEMMKGINKKVRSLTRKMGDDELLSSVRELESKTGEAFKADKRSRIFKLMNPVEDIKTSVYVTDEFFSKIEVEISGEEISPVSFKADAMSRSTIAKFNWSNDNSLPENLNDLICGDVDALMTTMKEKKLFSTQMCLSVVLIKWYLNALLDHYRGKCYPVKAIVYSLEEINKMLASSLSQLITGEIDSTVAPFNLNRNEHVIRHEKRHLMVYQTMVSGFDNVEDLKKVTTLHSFSNGSGALLHLNNLSGKSENYKGHQLSKDNLVTFAGALYEYHADHPHADYSSINKEFVKSVITHKDAHKRKGSDNQMMYDALIKRGCGVTEPELIAYVERVLEIWNTFESGEVELWNVSGTNNKYKNLRELEKANGGLLFAA